MENENKTFIGSAFTATEYVFATLSTLIMMAFMLNDNVAPFLEKVFTNDIFIYGFLGGLYAYIAYFIFTIIVVCIHAFKYRKVYDASDYNFGFVAHKLLIIFVIMISTGLTFKLTTMELERKRVDAIVHVYDRYCTNSDIETKNLVWNKYHDLARNGELDDHPVKFYGWVTYIEKTDTLTINCPSIARQVALRTMK